MDTINFVEILRQKIYTNPLDLAKEIKKFVFQYKNKEKDIYFLYEVFSSLYDIIYYDILTKKIKIEKNIQRILECLASPAYIESDVERQKLLKKIMLLK